MKSISPMETPKPAPKKWTYQEACVRLRQLEGENDLLNRHRCLGWMVWPLVRTVIARRMCDIRVNMARDQKESAGIGNFFAMVWDGVRVVLKSGVFRRKVMTITMSSEWRTPSPRGTNSIYIGDLTEELSDHVMVEFLNRASAIQDRSSRAWPVLGSLTFWNKLAHRIRCFLVWRGRYRIQAAAIKHELDELESEAGFELISEGEAQEILCGFVARFRLFRWLWGRLQPRVIALTCFYTKEAHIAAAKSLGIRVIELQHGTIYDGHFAYSYDPAHLRDCDQTPFPDLFCVYGSYWLEAMDGFGYWQTEGLRVCGSVEVDRVRALRSAGPPASPNKVVVTTQGIHVEVLLEFLEKLFGSLRAKWHFVIRSHPLQNEEPLREWVARIGDRYPRITLEYSSGASSGDATNEIIAGARWHASISSTCHVEALGIGIPTVVIPLPTSEIIKSLRGRIGAYFPSTPEEMVEILENMGADTSDSDVDFDFYFKSGALGNLARALDEGDSQEGRGGMPRSLKG